jgi:hypothetical protein
MTRRRIGVLIVGLILLASLGAAFLLLQSSDKESDNDLWLSQHATTEITSIAASDNRIEKQMTLTVKGEKWSMDSGEQITQDRIAPLLSSLGYLKAAYRVDSESASDLGAYGLADPSVTFRVSYEDGSDQAWSIGDSQGGQGVYLRGEEDASVYLVDDVRADVMMTAVRNFLEVPMDQIDFDKVSGVYITKPGEEQVRLNRSESPRSGGDFFWRIFSPYSSNADKALVDEVITTVADEGWVRKSDDAGADVGLDDKSLNVLNLYDSYDRELSITFGAVGGNREADCVIKDLPGVYKIGGDVLKVFEADSSAFIDRTLYYYEPASVDKFTFTWEDRAHTLTAIWEEIGDGEEQGQRFKMDGGNISGGGYYEFAKNVAELQCEDTLIQADDKLGDVLGTMEIERISFPYEQTIKFCRLEDKPDFVGVDYGGNVIVYIEISKLAKLMDRLENLE